jgi:hypothetical protein
LVSRARYITTPRVYLCILTRAYPHPALSERVWRAVERDRPFVGP